MIEYAMAGRRLTLWPATASLVATWYGGILGVSESVSFYGVGAWLLVGVPYYIFGIIYAVFFASKVRESQHWSIPEQIGSQFGEAPRKLAGGLMFLLGLPAAHVLMLGVLLQLFFGGPLWVCVALAGFLGSILIFKSGLIADVRMSIAAFIAMYLGFAIMAYYNFKRVQPTQLLSSLSPELSSWTGAQNWIGIFTFFVLGAWTLVDPSFHQRVSATESPKTGRKMVLISVGFWMLFDFLSISAALYAIQSSIQVENGMTLFPIFASEVLPTGIRGLFLCGLVGTILSAYAGYSFVSATSLGREVHPNPSKKTIRLSLVVSTVLAIVIGASVQSVVVLWYSWAGLIVGSLLVPFVLAYSRTKWSIASSWVLASTIISFVTTLITWMIASANGNPFLTLGLVNDQEVSFGTLLPSLLISSAILSAGFLVHKVRNESQVNRS